MNTTAITVRHCPDHHGQPLLVLERLPLNLRGEGAELYPATARAFAHALLQAADDCEAAACTLKRGIKVRRTYDIAAGCAA